MLDMNDAYAAIAPHYDLEFAEFDADVDLYLGYASYVGSPILELGSGTGRLLVPLAQAGYQVTGLDSSESMVSIAKKRLAEHGLNQVSIDLGSMTDLDHYPASHFRMVFSAINSFLHLESRDEQLTALREVRRVLHDDGILVIDLFHPTPAVLQSMDDQVRHDGHWDLPDGARLDRFSHRHLLLAEQRIETTLYYDRTTPEGQLSRQVARYTMRYIHRFEMEGLLSEAGYVLEGVYGSYSLDPLDDHSEQMIFVAHRRP